MKLYANPYDIERADCAFYFDSFGEYEDRYAGIHKKFQVEEYEIEFIEGTESELALFSAASVCQASLAEFYETLGLLAEHELPAFYFLMAHNGYNMKEARSMARDQIVGEQTAEDAAQEQLDDMLAELDISERKKVVIAMYFDVERKAQDMQMNGEITEFDFDGRTFTIDRN